METKGKGSLFGAIMLIAGCCIGAGMLGLPVMSAVTGFKPSLLMFVFGWMFMTLTALLLLEVNLWFSNDVSLISMAGKTLGVAGKVVSWGCFLFLFYALGVAYIAASGGLLSEFALRYFGASLPNWVGSLVICLIFGVFLYLGTGAVDKFNRLLMVGLIASYLFLVVLGSPYVESRNLEFRDWSTAMLVLPIIIISFGFHNMIPSLKTYLNGDVNKLKWAVILGGAIPLIIYIVWEWLILGIIPANGHENYLEILDKGEMATDALQNAVGSLKVVDAAQFFALFAILTSFLGNSLSFVDFLSDGLRIRKDVQGKIFLCCLVILPPFLLSLLYPHLFLIALNFAGAFGAVVLFGILPALMVWAGRYHQHLEAKWRVPGGRLLLICVILFSIIIMGLQGTL